MEELGLSPEKFQEMLDHIQKLLKQMEGDLSDLTKALLNNNRAELSASCAKRCSRKCRTAATPKPCATRPIRA